MRSAIWKRSKARDDDRMKAKPIHHGADEADFLDAMQDVVPLTRAVRVEHARPRPAPIPLQRMRDEASALRESLRSNAHPDAGIATGEELIYVRAGVPRSVLKNLRCGHWVIREDLDLHGL